MPSEESDTSERESGKPGDSSSKWLSNHHESGLTENLMGLQSERCRARFKQIAGLRARGVADHVDLPQLVVCGDQSTGKSSVLEGVTRIPFPRQDGLCTKFPTEIILEHSEEPLRIFGTIIPAKNRNLEEKAKLSKVQRELESFDGLPNLINEVGKAVGVRGHSDSLNSPAFVEDILRIKVIGPTGMHLSIVDLPGLFSSPNEEQTDEDKKLVHRMVDSYAENPRTIILAVVQAGNDPANQSIIGKSQRFDEAGERTVGVITKPDLINECSEKRIALLANNQDTTKLKLGYFLLKNPNPTEIDDGITPEQRQKNEIRYFQSSPWKEQGLNYDRVGIESLRTFVQKLLDKHVERELPKVREEVKSLLKQTQKELVALGEPRSTTADERMFLTRVSMEFHRLVVAALDGNYHEANLALSGSWEFDEQSERLRAVVQGLNTKFSEYMRQEGQKRKIVEQSEAKDDDESQPANAKPEKKDQILVTESEMREWVRKVYISNRGKELPGTYNHIVPTELFHIQSSRWIDIAQDHVERVFQRISCFIKAILARVALDQQLYHELLDLVRASLDHNKKAADAELQKIWEDEKIQPITYNHYFTDNVQNCWNDTAGLSTFKALQEAYTNEYDEELHITTQDQVERLASAVQKGIVVDMDEHACTRALSELDAYYKVARKTFVDNVCRQVIERQLLRNLPKLFRPKTVAALSDEELARIAAEPTESKERRERVYKNLSRVYRAVLTIYENDPCSPSIV